jgi:hypothetical protein
VLYDSFRFQYCFSFNFIVSWLRIAAGRRHALNSTLLQANSDKRESPIQKFICDTYLIKACFSNITSGMDRFITDSILAFFLNYTTSFVKRVKAAAGSVTGNTNTNTNTHFKDSSNTIIPGIQFCSDHRRIINLSSSKHRINFKLTYCGKNTRTAFWKNCPAFRYCRTRGGTLSIVLQLIS